MNYIEPLEARIAPAILIVTTTSDSGAGSLRQAILDANSDVDFDVINFNIPGNQFSAKRIELTSELPAITQSLLIDGYTQPGASVNTQEVGTNAQIRIEIDGSDFDLAQSSGLRINGNSVTIRGLAIFGFQEINDLGGAAIFIDDALNATVSGCFLGTDASGEEGRGNDFGGVRISNQATAVTIGGSTLASRNLISNNLSSGVIASGENVIISGNLIGTKIDGLSALPNRNAGIEMKNLADAIIGGNEPAERNTIAHNREEGIFLTDGATGVDIQQNRFFRNGGLAIDIGGNGVTMNDALDVDNGPNGQQNMPEITGVVNGSLATVAFRLESTANTNFRIDFYTTTLIDPTGYGEGREYIGGMVDNTDGNGILINETQFLDGFAPGTTITATATNLATGQTSEFSLGFNINVISFPNDTTATWIDGDGDAVTLKITKGVLEPSQFFFGPGNEQQSNVLQMLQLKGSEFSGTNVTVTVKKAGFGDGRVAIGYIDASLTDLGNVSIRGDLGRLVCGDLESTTISLKSLKVNSMGLAGAFTLPDGIGDSKIRGAVGSVAIAGDMRGVTFGVDPINPFDPEILARTVVGSFKVGGNVIADSLSTVIRIDGNLNSLTIGRALIGLGDGISVTRSVGKVVIGSISDASISLGQFFLDSTPTGSVLIKGNASDARISVGETISKITVLGSLIGTGSGRGTISGDTLNSVLIKGDVIASGDLNDEDIFGAGVITAGKTLRRLTIGGSMMVSDDNSGEIQLSGRIGAKTLGSVIIGGSTIGTEDNPVTIGGTGSAVKPTVGFDVAIGSVLIKGSAIYTQIVAGLVNQTPLNADASIGSVTVKKDWVASSIAAGVEDTGPVGFGVGDTLQSVGDTALVARIASISIKGSFLPGANPLINYGFAAEEITRASIGGVRLPLDAGPSNDAGNQWTYSNLGYLEVM